MNYEVNNFRVPHAKEQSYARSIGRALALPFLAPVGALGATGAGALWLANNDILPLWALGAGWTGCVAAAAAAVAIFARRSASGIAIPADALRGLAFPDGQLLTDVSEGGKPTGGLAALQVEFAALATSLVGRLARDTQLASDLARAKEDAQSANLAKSQFLADMSHQLRTPLNAIIGYATLLQEDAVASARAEDMDDLDRILNASRTLLELINYIIDLSRLEAGKTSFQRSILDISSLIFSVVSSFDLKKHGNGNALEVEVSSDIGIMVGDAAKIRQCLLNLISNGLKFTHDGEVRLKVETLQERAVECIRFSVSDTGVGMSEEQAAGLFQDQGSDPESRYNPASGPKLGLAITKRLVTLMGGNVEVNSVPGEGSVFTLTIPREMPRTVATDDAPPRPARHSGIRLPQIGRKALIIDDEPSAIDIAGRWLSRLGYSVISASDGEEGLALARSEKPDLIILDIFMPGRTGHDVMQAIRADEALNAIPVIVVTVLDDRSSVLKSGASDCLTKPVQPRQLEQVLDVYKQRIEGEILVIEDDADAGLLIRRTAAQIGLTSRLARSGEEGLAMIRTERPAAIVLDLGLPGMSGFQVLEEVAEDPALKNIPVIIVSGREISVLEHQTITKAGGIFHPKGHSSPREIAQSLRLVVGS